MTKVYEGRRSLAGVTVDGRPLDPRLDLHSLSRAGFEWGYEGGGPGQLALAILADHFGDDARAQSAYKRFRTNVIAVIEDDEWALDGEAIERALVGVVDVPLTLEQFLDRVRGRESDGEA